MKEFTLFDYQEKDVQVLTNRGRMLNANAPGLGKTLECLETCKRRGDKMILIVCPKISLAVWQLEAMKFFGWNSIILDGTPKQRKAIKEQFLSSTDDVKILITNFKKCKELGAWGIHWDMIAIDEIHLGGLLNHKTATFKDVAKLNSSGMILMTGTPIRRNPADLFAPLSLLYPDKFKAYWGFVNRYCIVVDGPFGKEIMGRPKSLQGFDDMLRPLMIRHKKEDVLKDLPPKFRQTVPYELSPLQRAAYEQMRDEFYIETDDDILVASGTLSCLLRLRQLLICPRILGIPEDGSALEAIATQYLPEEIAAGRAALIATPYKVGIPFIREAVEKANPGIHVYEIHGDVKESAQIVANRFQEDQTKNKTIIYTIKSGASWTAHSASTTFFLGYEPSAIDNVQAEDRIHRIGQTENVFIKYMLCPGTVDSDLMAILDDKTMAERYVLEASEMIRKIKERQLSSYNV